jgi:hypothetical protein
MPVTSNSLLLRPEVSSPEHELLLRCARTRIDAQTAEEIRALAAGPLDWKALRKLAQGHQVTPLLYRTLAEVAPDAVPPAVLARLGALYQANVAHNLQLGYYLTQVLDLLERAGIPVVPLKGLALAVSAYDDPTLRLFRDLDLLVRPADAFRAREVLEANGYDGFPKLTPVQMGVFLRSECEFWFASPGDHFPLEVHWDFREPVYSYPMDAEECWSRLEPLEVAGRPVRVLGLEDTLLMLSCHGAKHRWGHLKLLCDIAELLRRESGLDWDSLLTRAAKLRGLRMLLLALRLAHELLGAPLPQVVRAKIEADSTLDRLAADVAGYLFDPARGDRQSPRGTRLYLRMREDVRDRARYGLSTLFTPTLEDWRSVPLPASLFSLYYGIRPARLALRTAWAMAGKLLPRSGKPVPEA